MEKNWRVLLPYELALSLFHLTRAGLSLGDRQKQRDLDAADDEVSEMLKVEYKLDGSWAAKATRDDEPFEWMYSERAIRGFKAALVQGITGVGQMRPCEATGVIKRTILPLAKLLRIEKLVRAESGYLDAKQGAEEKLTPDSEAVSGS